MISTKSRSSLFPSLSLSFSSLDAHGQSALSLRLFLFDLPSSLSFSSTSRPFPHIDEFIAGTARSIVTKIVYDIDSSFYVNPVSEWFWSTCRGRAFCIRTRTRQEEENVTMSCERMRRVVVHVSFRDETGGRDDELSTNLRGNGRNPETYGALRSVMSSLC